MAAIKAEQAKGLEAIAKKNSEALNDISQHEQDLEKLLQNYEEINSSEKAAPETPQPYLNEAETSEKQPEAQLVPAREATLLEKVYKMAEDYKIQKGRDFFEKELAEKIIAEEKAVEKERNSAKQKAAPSIADKLYSSFTAAYEKLTRQDVALKTLEDSEKNEASAPLEEPELEKPDLKKPDLKKPNLKKPNLKKPNLKKPNLKKPNLEKQISEKDIDGEEEKAKARLSTGK